MVSKQVMGFEGYLALCDIAIAKIRIACKDTEEGGKDRTLLGNFMDELYNNLGICRRLGYGTRFQKERYQTARASFVALQKQHGMFYDDDDL